LPILQVNPTTGSDGSIRFKDFFDL